MQTYTYTGSAASPAHTCFGPFSCVRTYDLCILCIYAYTHIHIRTLIQKLIACTHTHTYTYTHCNKPQSGETVQASASFKIPTQGTCGRCDYARSFFCAPD